MLPFGQCFELKFMPLLVVHDERAGLAAPWVEGGGGSPALCIVIKRTFIASVISGLNEPGQMSPGAALVLVGSRWKGSATLDGT